MVTEFADVERSKKCVVELLILYSCTRLHIASNSMIRHLIALIISPVRIIYCEGNKIQISKMRRLQYYYYYYNGYHLDFGEGISLWSGSTRLLSFLRCRMFALVHLYLPEGWLVENQRFLGPQMRDRRKWRRDSPSDTEISSENFPGCCLRELSKETLRNRRPHKHASSLSTTEAHGYHRKCLMEISLFLNSLNQPKRNISVHKSIRMNIIWMKETNGRD